MPEIERRGQPDRRRNARGGKRPYDRPGRYPPVLVADSYEGARRPCARYLQRLSFDVSEAANTEEALAGVLKSPPRLILAEWRLPGSFGPKPSQWLDPTLLSTIPVILIANTEDPGARPPQVAGILRKPFSLDQLIAEVRRVLREKYPFPTAPNDLLGRSSVR